MSNMLDDLLDALALGHNPDASKLLIEYFSEQIEAGSLFNDTGRLSHKETVFLNFIGCAFKEFSSGKTLDVAFGLQKPRGRPANKETADRNLSIAAAVEIDIRNSMKKQGVSRSNFRGYDAAYNDAASKFWNGEKVEKTTVENSYKQYEDELKGLSDNELEAIKG